MKSYEKRWLPIRKTMIGLAILLTISFTTSSSFADVILASTAMEPISLNTAIDPPAPTGQLGFSAGSATIANTGNVATATMFTIPNWTTLFGDGDFAGEPIENLGTVTLTLSPLSYVVSGPIFGTFTASSIVSDTITPPPIAFRSIGLFGSFTPGSFLMGKGFGSGPFPADFGVTFSQTMGGTITASGTFAPRPVPVPEPATWTVLGISFAGLTGFAFLDRIRRRWWERTRR